MMSNLLLLALAGTAVLVFEFVCITYVIFWYETANTSYRQELDRLSHGKTKAWILRGILSSCLSLFLVLLFYPFAFCKRFRHPEPDVTCQSPPVILIHGLYHNAGAWMLYRYWLKRAGFKNVYAFNYDSWSTSFEECRQGLENLVREVRSIVPQRKVVLVGHSLGGLLSRACGDFGACREDIEAVITLATPHRGSKLAVLGLGRLAKSLVYGGTLMGQLERTAFSGRNIPRLALYSPVDNMVLPNEALRTCCEGWVHRRISPISHMAILYHRPTAKYVVETLLSIPYEPA